MVTIKSKREIELMREACRVVAVVYDELEKHIKPGITTLELDQIAERTMINLGALPAEKGYDPGIKGVPKFPASICVSINDEVIHGIPSKYRTLKEGDIVSIDTVALKDGFNGDAARTFIVGKTNKENQRLVDVTKQAFFEGIKYAKKGNKLVGVVSVTTETLAGIPSIVYGLFWTGCRWQRFWKMPKMLRRPAIRSWKKPAKRM